MPNMRQSLIAVATFAFAGRSFAQSAIARTCPIPSSGICYELNIPEVTASSGTGDIFFSISAPTRYTWVALGQGDEMPNSNIFVVYTSGDGKNVTVSTRPSAGTGHTEPQYSADGAKIEVLAGSGVSNGVMTAHVRCMNCQSWNGGTMDFTGTTGSWIHAEKSGAPLMSDDPSADISMHDERGVFTWNFASAKGGNDANPFIAAAASTTSSTSPSDSTNSDDGGDDGNEAMLTNVQMAHGVIAALVFVIIFPTGGILVRVASFPGLVWVHAGIQMLGYLMFISAFGLGLWLALQQGQATDYHPIVGYVLFAILLLQPLGGLLHHNTYKKTGKRSMFSYAHLLAGRVAIILGMIQGGLGLMFADDASSGQRAAYGVVAGVFGVAYIAAALFGERKRAATPKQSISERDGSSSEHKTSV